MERLSCVVSDRRDEGEALFPLQFTDAGDKIRILSQLQSHVEDVSSCSDKMLSSLPH